MFIAGVDSVQSGLVVGLNRPGGNATGITHMNAELGGKRLGLLHELLPAATRIAVLAPNSEIFTSSDSAKDMQKAASTIERQLEFFPAGTGREIDAAFARLVQGWADGLVVMPTSVITNRRFQIITLATRHAIHGVRMRSPVA